MLIKILKKEKKKLAKSPPMVGHGSMGTHGRHVVPTLHEGWRLGRHCDLCKGWVKGLHNPLVNGASLTSTRDGRKGPKTPLAEVVEFHDPLYEE